MFNTSIIDVGVGLFFVFSLLAILVTQINTIITQLLNLRAKQLKIGLQNLVTDKTVQAKLLAHPIINMVKASVPTDAELNSQAAENIIDSEESDLTWIAPSTFVEALMGILIAKSDESLYQPLAGAINAMPNCLEKSQLRELYRRLQLKFSEETIREIYNIIDTVTDEQQRDELTAGIQEVEDSLAQLRFKSNQLVPLIDGIEKIHDPKFKSALQSILATAESVEEARVKLEAWFNDGMDRVSTTFKQHLQIYSVLVAFILALILNVDTLYLARSLWENPELRQSLVAAANEFDQQAFIDQPDTETEDETEGDTAPEGETGQPNLQDVGQQAEAAGETIQSLLELQLPVGWQYTAVTDNMVETSLRLGLPDPRANPRNIWNFLPGNNGDWWGLLIQKLLGLVATTIAAAQGAPFWFDLLNKLSGR